MKEELEVWKDIPEYEGIYQVSNLGRVKSLPREWVSGIGAIVKHKGKILKGGTSNGYRIVKLYVNGNIKVYLIHQLVAIAFLNHKPDGHKLVIDHINDNKSDNRVENLQIVTNRFNVYKTQGKYKSNYKGVTWDKKSNKWASKLQVSGECIHLGMFESEEEASKYYQNAIKSIEKGTEIKIKKPKKYSKYKGVTYLKKSNKWQSQMFVNGKIKYLGLFKCELAASHAYQKALKEL